MNHSAPSRITIGGGRFSRLEPQSVSKLINLAFELGIRRIDTAPTYPESEKKIGFAIKGSDEFEITTKVGPSPGQILNAEVIKKSVDNSLAELGLDNVECIYLHSVNPKQCDDSAFSALLELKKAGVTKRIGVSADNDELEVFFQMGIFDQFMASFSIVDQSNYRVMDKIRQNDQLHLAIKRSLANGVWRNDTKARGLHLYRLLRNENEYFKIGSYRNRHLEMSKALGIRLAGHDYMQFIFSEFKSASCLIGTNNPEHLMQFRKAEELSTPNSGLNAQIRKVYETTANKQWSALT